MTINANPSKKYELVKTSLIYQTREFFNNSTLHGVRYIAENGRPFFDKFLWICCTSVGATVTLIIIVSLWEKFQTNPTITGLDTDFHNWDVQFPGLSFCQFYPVDPDRVENLIENHIVDKDALRDYFTIIGTLNRQTINDMPDLSGYPDFPRIGLREIAKEVVYRCESIIKNCYWKENGRSCCKNTLYPAFTENGFCYVFNAELEQNVFTWDGDLRSTKQEFIYETDPKWAFELEMANVTDNPVFVYIHSSNQQPSFDLKAHHTWDGRISKIAFSVKTTYTTSDVRQLSIKQRRCIFHDEIKLLTESNYTYIACMRECRIKKLLELCKCVPFIYKTISGSPECDYDGLVCFKQHLREILFESKCFCELPCDNSVYEVEKLTEGSGDSTAMEVAFVSWPMIRYKREVLFGWVDLLGIAGLFLGFSLLSGVEVIYFFTLRACCMVLREKKTLEQIQKEYEIQEKPVVDLSLTPYFVKNDDSGREISASRVHYIQPY